MPQLRPLAQNTMLNKNGEEYTAFPFPQSYWWWNMSNISLKNLMSPENFLQIFSDCESFLLFLYPEKFLIIEC